MARIARLVMEDFPHHITHRGNRKDILFKDDEDRNLYLDLMQYYIDKFDMDLWAYCLMDNHVHFVGVPHRGNSMAEIFRAVQMRYCQHFNKKYDFVGHLWQGRYYSCPMDEEHSFIAVRYIENNPVRAGYVDKPGEYKWSSAKARIDGVTDVLLRGKCWLDDTIDNWSDYLFADDSDGDIKALKKCTRRGDPFGTFPFRKMIEKITGRPLWRDRPGRPKTAVL